MKKNMNNQAMDEELKAFLPEIQKPVHEPADVSVQVHEDVQADTEESPQANRRISGRQRRASLEEYKETFLPVPTIEDRKPVFLSRSTRDALDRIVRMFGERRMSVSGLVENITRQHLAAYGEDIDAWRKL